MRVDLACGPTRVLRSIHEEAAVFLAPFSSDQPVRMAGAAGFRQAGVHTEPRRRTLAAENEPCKRNARSKRRAPSDRGRALGRSAAGRGCFSASTALAQPYSNLYQPHQRFRAELGK